MSIYKLFILIPLMFILSFSLLHAQPIQRSGSIVSEITNVINQMPGNGGDNYVEPSNAELDTWENTLNLILQSQFQTAADSANAIGYNLVEFLDNTFSPNRTYYFLESQGINFWGTYVYYPEYCRPLVIQSPHPRRDFNTGRQGLHIFVESESLFFFLSGTHRCNSPNFSSCTGTSSNCSGSTEPYRISDLAHTTQSTFQRSTAFILDQFKDSHFIQLHGFTKQTSDPYVILSNGTQNTPCPDYLYTFKDKLSEADNTLTFKVAHKDLNWTRLRGFWNTQGRLINSSLDACSINANASQGRFFHVEQEKTKLRDNIAGWNKVLFAVNNTFLCPAADYLLDLNGVINVQNDKDILMIQLLSGDYTVEILDAMDQVYQNINITNTYELDKNLLPVGIFYLKITNNTSGNICYRDRLKSQ